MSPKEFGVDYNVGSGVRWLGLESCLCQSVVCEVNLSASEVLDLCCGTIIEPAERDVVGTLRVCETDGSGCPSLPSCPVLSPAPKLIQMLVGCLYVLTHQMWGESACTLLLVHIADL